MAKSRYEYAGFWIRLCAVLIDSFFMFIITVGLVLLVMVTGVIDVSNLPQTEETSSAVALVLQLFVQIFWFVFMIVCWVKWGGTPGKRLLKLKVLDAETGRNLTVGKAILRSIGYVASSVLLCLGYIWVAFDAKKQGWHDKIASTVVVKELD